jgi:hypothetical protein
LLQVEKTSRGDVEEGFEDYQLNASKRVSDAEKEDDEEDILSL